MLVISIINLICHFQAEIEQTASPARDAQGGGDQGGDAREEGDDQQRGGDAEHQGGEGDYQEEGNDAGDDEEDYHGEHDQGEGPEGEHLSGRQGTRQGKNTDDILCYRKVEDGEFLLGYPIKDFFSSNTSFLGRNKIQRLSAK